MVATGLGRPFPSQYVGRIRIGFRPQHLPPCFLQHKTQLGALRDDDSSLVSDIRELVDLLNKGDSGPDDAAGLPSTAISPNDSGDSIEEEFFADPERAYLVGIQRKKDYMNRRYGYGIAESLRELESLAKTAGLEVVGKTHQSLEPPSSATYIGQGKVREVADDAEMLDAETVVFDEELSPVQLKNLDNSLGEDVRVCDRTALTLDIFSQRARTKEGKLQVELAQVEYQLPRLTRMWSHLERQVGGSGSKGAVKGMGEKQIEVDKRILRKRISSIKRELEEVRTQRKHARDRRARNNVPVVALAGYTNAGKSTLLNKMTQSDVLVEDKLFATLDPTTRQLGLPSGKEALLSDTVGFIQKLPTQLVAAFRATLEEMHDAALILHVVDISHKNAAIQADAVTQVLKDIGVSEVPILTVWNKLDKCSDPDQVKEMAEKRQDVVCISSISGEGIDDLLKAIEAAFKDAMIPMNLCIPFTCGDIVDLIHKHGIVKHLEYSEEGSIISASVPLYLAGRLGKYKTRSILQSFDS